MWNFTRNTWISVFSHGSKKRTSSEQNHFVSPLVFVQTSHVFNIKPVKMSQSNFEIRVWGEICRYIETGFYIDESETTSIWSEKALIYSKIKVFAFYFNKGILKNSRIKCVRVQPSNCQNPTQLNSTQSNSNMTNVEVRHSSYVFHPPHLTPPPHYHKLFNHF